MTFSWTGSINTFFGSTPVHGFEVGGTLGPLAVVFTRYPVLINVLMLPVQLKVRTVLGPAPPKRPALSLLANFVPRVSPTQTGYF
jgi:hypothetical protein